METGYGNSSGSFLPVDFVQGPTTIGIAQPNRQGLVKSLEEQSAGQLVECAGSDGGGRIRRDAHRPGGTGCLRTLPTMATVQGAFTGRLVLRRTVCVWSHPNADLLAVHIRVTTKGTYTHIRKEEELMESDPMK